MMKRPTGVRAHYDSIARFYDAWDAIPEWLLYRSWRRRLWSKVGQGTILEIGVGTGKNIDLYPTRSRVTAIDISRKMLDRAAARARSRPDITIGLALMDAGGLAFQDGAFDTVVGSFLLMVAPDPLKALAEILRVCRPGGKLLALEFTRSANPAMALLQNALTPLTSAAYHARVNQDIAAMAQQKGFHDVTAEKFAGGMVSIVQAFC